MATQLRARDVRPNEQVAEVEGRDCDDWMLVDAGNIIINIFEAGMGEKHVGGSIFGLNCTQRQERASILKPCTPT